MEQRRHRVAVLLLVVALHVPAWLALRGLLQPRAVATDRALVVEFVLNEARPPRPRPPSPPRNRTRESAKPRSSRPIARPTPAPPSPASVAVPVEAAPVRLFSADGSLRIPSGMAEAVAEKPAPEPANSFHIPTGDTWVLREPVAPIEFRDTVFAQAYLPDDMNPIEEACWRNKGLAFVLAMLGSTDCAAPGQKAKVPPPALIVYGVDDGDEIMRKTDAWSRYNER